MASAVSSSSRAVARSVPRFTAPKKSSLVYQMHKQLYPHLYTKDAGSGSESPENAAAAAQLTKEKVKEMVEKSRAARKAYWTQKKPGRFDVLPSRTKRHTAGIQIHPTKPSVYKKCPDPVSTIASSQIALLDPTGARTRLFAKTNPECARVGDVLLVRQRNGDPFAGVCINIRRRGVDTAILLRGQLTRVGVEMWYKVYSPLVEGIEIVQRAQKRARRARLTYMRTPKHDKGSVENVVRVYLRQKAALGSADGKKKGGAAGGGGGGNYGGAKKGGNRKGKKR